VGSQDDLILAFQVFGSHDKCVVISGVIADRGPVAYVSRQGRRMLPVRAFPKSVQRVVEVPICADIEIVVAEVIHRPPSTRTSGARCQSFGAFAPIWSAVKTQPS